MAGNYTLIAEYQLSPTPKRAAGWIGRLSPDYSPAVGHSELGLAQVTVTVHRAIGMDVAAAEGREALRRAIGVEPVRWQIMSEAIFHRLLERSHPEYIGVTDAGRQLGVSRQRVLALVNAGELPAIRVGNTIGIPVAAIAARAKHVGVHNRTAAAGG